jgi:hypothetical protein
LSVENFLLFLILLFSHWIFEYCHRPALSLVSFLGSGHMNVKTAPQVSEVLLIFTSIISVALSYSSLVLSSLPATLLLNLYTELFYSSYCLLQFKISIWFFFFFPSIFLLWLFFSETFYMYLFQVCFNVILIEIVLKFLF